MCGIISVVRRPGARVAPSPDAVTQPLHQAVAILAQPGSLASTLATALGEAADHVEASDALLKGSEGVWALVHDRRLLAEVEGLAASLTGAVAAIEKRLDAGDDVPTDPAQLETVNAAVVRVKDAVWAVAEDRVRTGREVAALAGHEPGWAAIEAYTSIQQALSAIDRLEVRGRDSAGLHVLVREHGLDLDSHALSGLLASRADDPLFRSGSVRLIDGCLSFVYKAAASLRIAPEITTDAKVIPTLVSRKLANGEGLTGAFRDTVAGFEGSV